MSGIKTAVSDFIKTGDNVAFMKTVKNEFYDRLGNNETFKSLANTIDKYTKKEQ